MTAPIDLMRHASAIAAETAANLADAGVSEPTPAVYLLAATVLADAANAAVGAPDDLVHAVFPELMNVARHLTGSTT